VIYKDLENPIVVGRYHSLSASGENLPKQLRVTAKTNNGEIMGVRHINHDIEGVQFHPESIMTKDGMTIMKNFLNLKE
jgi:anthranilate/para-aminobenzoate synthase component II